MKTMQVLTRFASVRAIGAPLSIAVLVAISLAANARSCQGQLLRRPNEGADSRRNGDEAPQPGARVAGPREREPVRQPRQIVKSLRWEISPLKWTEHGQTMGGKQFWSDEMIHSGWRIQRNILTGHCRLLDGKNTRHMWGDYDQCQAKFKQLRAERKIALTRGRVLLALHGTGRSRSSMQSLCDYLQKNSDLTTLNVSYASTRGTIDEHAKSLARLISNLDQASEINFVAHSMGNLVIRHYLGDQTDRQKGRQADPRIKRIVMLAPPNSGTRMATSFQNNPLFKLFWGTSGKQMAEEFPQLAQRMAIPSCEFGIIAGDASKTKLKNPLLLGKNDLVVSVDETKLPGATDFCVLPVTHSFIMRDDNVRSRTLRFLQHGYFVSAKTRQPLPKQMVAPQPNR